MQETQVERLLPTLVDQLDHGVELKSLVAAAALANVRTFGGEDYIGYHTLMALSPAWQMSREMSGPRQALPVFKVLYRNTNRIGEHGGRPSEVLHQVQPATLSAGESSERDAARGGRGERSRSRRADVRRDRAKDATRGVRRAAVHRARGHASPPHRVAVSRVGIAEPGGRRARAYVVATVGPLLRQRAAARRAEQSAGQGLRRAPARGTHAGRSRGRRRLDRFDEPDDLSFDARTSRRCRGRGVGRRFFAGGDWRGAGAGGQSTGAARHRPQCAPSGPASRSAACMATR